MSRAIYPLHSYGGMERHCHDWILTMAEQGCSVNVITMPPENFYSKFPNSVRFHFIPGKPARKVLARITKYPHWVRNVRTFLSKLVQQETVDAIYAHGLAAAGCIGFSVPVFYNPHGMEEFKTRGPKFIAYAPFRSMSRAAAKDAAKVIATDKSLVPEIRKFLNVTEEKIVMIPNSVRFEHSQPVGPGLVPAHLESANPVFLSVGRLERNKGFHILLRALGQSKGLPANWKLVIAGAGSMKTELSEIANSLGIEKHVLFAGEVAPEELEGLYHCANLFIHPSLYEGSSIVTLEAMIHRLPIIATTVGGLPDKVRPDQNGWLVPPADSSALSKTILHACSVQDRWKEMGKSSEVIVREQFSWDRAGELFLETFRQAK